ncbi:MAG: circularly permuted type 2 ATP-grasp protein, partial [Verrucomicrobiaceae bacterium]
MLFQGYDKGDFCDEMLAEDGSVRPHYGAIHERFGKLDASEWAQRQTATDLAFMRGGVTFTVYNDSQGTERIFPFDLVPRVIPATEWDVIERGLVQ